MAREAHYLPASPPRTHPSPPSGPWRYFFRRGHKRRRCDQPIKPARKSVKTELIKTPTATPSHCLEIETLRSPCRPWRAASGVLRSEWLLSSGRSSAPLPIWPRRVGAGGGRPVRLLLTPIETRWTVAYRGPISSQSPLRRRRRLLSLPAVVNTLQSISAPITTRKAIMGPSKTSAMTARSESPVPRFAH